MLQIQNNLLFDKYKNKKINPKFFVTMSVSISNIKELTEEEFKSGKQGYIWMDNKTYKPIFKENNNATNTK